MRLKHNDVEIPQDDPFRDDKLERKDIGSFLTDLVSSIDEPFVLAVNGKWGHGKTTFLKMWLRSLTIGQPAFPTLYFNAWESDFTEDPMIAFTAELGTAIENAKLDKKEKERAKEHFKIAKQYSTRVAKRLIPLAAKLATAGAIDLDQISEKAIADSVEKLVSEQIESYEKDKSTIANLRDSLEKLATSLNASQTKDRRPLIFVIDELDRCRPLYAIQLLERLKHLFAVRGIVFILGVDIDQLGKSVQTLYGQNMDATGYLRRFIDLEFTLPIPAGPSFASFLMTRFGFESFFSSRSLFPNEQNEFLETFWMLAEELGLTPREQEQSFTRISVILRTTNLAESLHPVLLVAMVFFRSKRPDLYGQFQQMNLKTQDVLAALSNTPAGRNFVGSELGGMLQSYVQIANMDTRALSDHVDTLQNNLNNSRYRDSEEQRRQQGMHRAALAVLNESSRGKIGTRLQRKIELTESFR